MQSASAVRSRTLRSQTAQEKACHRGPFEKLSLSSADATLRVNVRRHHITSNDSLPPLSLPVRVCAYFMLETYTDAKPHRHLLIRRSGQLHRAATRTGASQCDYSILNNRSFDLFGEYR